MPEILKHKCLLIADLHIHPTPDWRFEWLVNFVSDILKRQETEFKGFDLFLPGDVLESRDNVASKCLNLMIHLMMNWKQGDVIWITGQHDSYLPGRATLEALEETGKVKIIDREVFHHKKSGIWFVPFARKEEDYRRMLAEVPDGATVFTHMPIVEIIEMYGAKDVKGIRLKEFDRFRQTYSGDIHKFHDFPRFTYIGAPSQRDWRDKGVEGVIATLVDGTFTRIPVKHPVHLEVENESDIPKDQQCIIRTRRGIRLDDHHNVLGATTKVELKPDAVKIEVGSQDSVLEDYVKENPLESIKAEKLKEYARTKLKEAEVA